VWLALEPEERSGFWITPDLIPRAGELGIKATVLRTSPHLPGSHAVVCSEADRAKAGNVPTVRFEHGAGFSFGGDHRPKIATSPSYPGGRNQRNVVMFASPNRYAQRRWQEVYPEVPCPVVGVPKMDRWHTTEPKSAAAEPVIALTWHWDARLLGETRWAFPWFESAIPAAAERFNLIAHSHPESQRILRPKFERLGIEWVEHLEEVFERADLLCNDSSSVLYEFASLDRPVVVLNAPWFRRDVNHGLRFWEHSYVGINCDRPEDLVASIHAALSDPPVTKELRREASAAVYPNRGRAAQAAASAMREVLDMAGART